MHTFQFAMKKSQKEDYGKSHKISKFLKPYIVAWINHSKHKPHKIIGDSTIESNLRNFEIPIKVIWKVQAFYFCSWKVWGGYKSFFLFVFGGSLGGIYKYMVLF